MKTGTFSLHIPTVLALVVGTYLLPSLSHAAIPKKNPTSKLFVVDIKGESQIDTGERIEPLTRKSVYSAEGTIIETKADSTDSLVLSNGTALFVAPETRFEIKKFLQEPFSPSRNDLDAEPSISQTILRLAHGAIGICTSKLVAGSTMNCVTPQGTINIRGRKVMVEILGDETRVSLLEGDVTVLGDTAGNGHTLRPGQQASIRRPSINQPPVVTIQAIPDETYPKLDENVSLACISRRTVYFEVVERNGQDGGDGSEIRPVEVAPVKPPTNFTVSPARL